jgi:hypothetical protein
LSSSSIRNSVVRIVPSKPTYFLLTEDFQFKVHLRRFGLEFLHGYQRLFVNLPAI